MTVRNYMELIVWQKAMDFVEAVYRMSARFPKEETYGLAAQIRRAVVSIPSNIAEGQGRQTTPDFLKFLAIAHGSLREVETQILIARRLIYVQEDCATDLMDLAAEIGRLLNGLMNSLRKL